MDVSFNKITLRMAIKSSSILSIRLAYLSCLKKSLLGDISINSNSSGVEGIYLFAYPKYDYFCRLKPIRL